MAPQPKKKDDRPWWVKQRRFAVPDTLQAFIHNLSEAEQIAFCYIVNKVVIETKKQPAVFRSIHSKYFNAFLGSGYRDYVNQLIGWRIIEVNEPYLNDPDGGFCKSYRLHPTALAARKVKVNFEKKQVHPLKDHSKLTDDVAQFVHRNIQRLAVRADLLAQADPIDEVQAEDGAEKIYFGQFNVHYSGKAKRLYHAIITMPRVARKNLVLKADPTTPLFEYDVKSCTPVILVGIADDPTEKAKLKSFLDRDIYTAIANEAGVTRNRDDIKTDFMLFVNGAVRNYVYEFFQQHLPILTAVVERTRKAEKASTKGMAWFGQRVESEIMVQLVSRQLMALGGAGPIKVQKSSIKPLTSRGNPEEILYIPMHDGWLGIERDEQIIAEAVIQEFVKRVGYWVTITKTKLTTGEKTILTLTPRPTART